MDKEQDALLMGEIEKLMQENQQLKEKIDKAIEYINNTNFWGIYEDIPMKEVKYGDDLLEILQGKDNK